MDQQSGMSVLVIDYGMGNLASVKRAFEECGASVFISDDPKAILQASQVVLPGVGSFALAMKNLHYAGWDDAIHEATEKGMPMLGICLGMQLLADEGEEHGLTKGLGLIEGKIKKFDLPGIRVPHVGWNEIVPKRDNTIFSAIESGTDFYFVHSYFFEAADESNILAHTPYGNNFTSVVSKGNIWGTQFHPEKSGFPGFQIIRNFLSVN